MTKKEELIREGCTDKFEGIPCQYEEGKRCVCSDKCQEDNEKWADGIIKQIEAGTYDGAY